MLWAEPWNRSNWEQTVGIGFSIIYQAPRSTTSPIGSPPFVPFPFSRFRLLFASLSGLGLQNPDVLTSEFWGELD